MRKTILAAILAVFAVPAAPALADAPQGYFQQARGHDGRGDSRRDWRRDGPRSDRGYRRDRRDDYRRDRYRGDRYRGDRYRGERWGYDRRHRGYDRGYRYDRGYGYNRGSRGYRGYYGYRGARYPYWSGNDGRYYCRRSNGTTGLIAGGALGAIIGRSADRGWDRSQGTILGAGVGALIGRELDRGNLRCR